MSGLRSRNHEADSLAGGAQAARRMAAQVRPLARGTAEAAARRVHKTRVWAAPQVERAGRVLQDSVAPRVSDLLSSAARRIEPASPPPRRRWRKLVGGSVFTAVAGAVAAALVRSRRKPDTATSAAEADADDVTPAAPTHDGQATTSTDTEANQPVRTS